MEKMYFANLTSNNESFLLNGFETQESCVSYETMDLVSDYFALDILDKDLLVELRNAVVRFYNDKIDQECIKDNNWTNLDLYNELETKLSMVTCVIDHHLFKMGGLQ